MKRILLTVAIMLLLPSQSLAYEKPSGILCNTSNVCHTIEATDKYLEVVTPSTTSNGWGYRNTGTNTYSLRGSECTYKYSNESAWKQAGSPVSSSICVYVGGVYVAHVFSKYQFSDIPQEDLPYFTPMSILTVSDVISGTTILQRSIGVQSSPANSYPYCTFYTYKKDGQPQKGIALDKTPNSVFTACSFAYRVSQKPATTTTETTTQTTTTPTTTQSSLKNCKMMTIDGDKFKLEAKGTTCIRARKLARSLYANPENKSFTLDEGEEDFKWTHKNKKIVIKITLVD